MLKSMIDVVILCGCMEPALRIRWEPESAISSEDKYEIFSIIGTLRAILKYHSKGDKKLAAILISSSRLNYL